MEYPSFLQTKKQKNIQRFCNQSIQKKKTNFIWGRNSEVKKQIVIFVGRHKWINVLPPILANLRLSRSQCKVAHVEPRRAIAILWDGPPATSTAHAALSQLDHEGQRRVGRRSQAAQQARQSRRRRYLPSTIDEQNYLLSFYLSLTHDTFNTQNHTQTKTRVIRPKPTHFGELKREQKTTREWNDLAGPQYWACCPYISDNFRVPLPIWFSTVSTFVSAVDVIDCSLCVWMNLSSFHFLFWQQMSYHIY